MYTFRSPEHYAKPAEKTELAPLDEEDEAMLREYYGEGKEEEETKDTGGVIHSVQLFFPPEAKQAVVVENDQTFFPHDRAGHGVLIVHPQVLQTIAKDKDFISRFKSMLCAQPILPFVVHQSPMTCLLATASTRGKGKEPRLSARVSVLDSLFSLFQLYAYCQSMHQEGVLKLDKSVNIDDCFDTYTNQRHAHRDVFLDQLAILYRGVVAGEFNQNTAMDNFAAQLQKYTFMQINLMETLLYELLIKGADTDLGLEHCLTPHVVFDNDKACDPSRAARLGVDFFCDKAEQQNMMLEKNAEDWREAQNKRTLNVERIRASGDVKTRETLLEYFCFMDFDNVLGH